MHYSTMVPSCRGYKLPYLKNKKCIYYFKELTKYFGMDNLEKEIRSKIMSSIKGKGTKPELIIRRCLSEKGIRYRIHSNKLPGKPDLSFPGKKIAVFINGCFWHNHNCKDGHIPSSNIEFWTNKIISNKERDKRNIKALKKMGWDVLILWECQIKTHPFKQSLKIEKKLVIGKSPSYKF